MKGSILDIAFMLVILLVLSVVSVFALNFMTEVNTRFQALDIPQEAKDATQNGADFFAFWDYIIIMALGGMMLVTLVASTQIEAHPVFFVGALLFTVVLIILASQFTEMFMRFVDTTSMIAYKGSFPLTVQFWANAPLIILMYSALLMLVMFAFGRNQNAF